MNQKKSLFHYLAFNFSKSPEDLATEALSYILNQSNTSKKAFIQFLKQAEPNLPDNVYFSTQQVGDEGERPDLIGVNPDGKEVVLGEAKFWAGLTSNQPVTYIKRLKKNKDSILVFIAPEKRIQTLWPEILRKCIEKGLKYVAIDKKQSIIKIALLDNYPKLSITSWRKVINGIRAAVEPEGDPIILADLIQLEGLSERMDESAFLPLRSEELSGPHGLRLIQYNSLIDDITNQLKDKELISLEGVRATPTREGYVRYMYINGYGCSLQKNANWWSQLRETPLWLTIQEAGKHWSFPEKAKEKLLPLELEEPSRLFRANDMLIIPLYLSTGVERDIVVTNILNQINEVIDLLKTE